MRAFETFGEDPAQTFVVGAADGGTRLDQYLASVAVSLTRAQVRRAIDEGRVSIDRRVAHKAGESLRAGQRVELQIVPPQPDRAEPQPIALDIVYEDADLVVVDKPAGLVVHPAVGHAAGTLVNALLHHCHDLSGIGGALRPGIVHRLDRDTSGLLVATKNDRAHAALAAQFAQHSVFRRYLALVAAGAQLGATGTVRRAIGRHPRDRKRFTSKAARGGKDAATHWRVVARGSGVAALIVALETGRTHQIRVHLADEGFPLLLDPTYGRTPPPLVQRLREGLDRQALHAFALGFEHPVSGVTLRFWRPPPVDLDGALRALFGDPGRDGVLAALAREVEAPAAVGPTGQG